MKRTLSFLFCFLIVLGLALMIIESLKETDHETDLENAATFLQNQFNSTLQLCAEAPNVAPDIYWLWNDNFLAYHALQYYNTTIAELIYAKLENYGYIKNYAYEALFNETLELPFHANIHYNVTEGADYTIKLDIYNGTTMNDWENYTNLLCLAALSEHWKCNESGAIHYFNQAAEDWDGYGLADASFMNRYHTYKLALLLYTERILGQSLSFHDAVETTMWQMQSSTNYGIHTDYDTNLDPSGSDVNVETTSLVIGSYKWVYEPLCPTISLLPKVFNNSVIAIVVVALIMFVISYLVWNRWKHR